MLKKKILTNTTFNMLSQAINIGFGIVLARMLFPEHFGVYGISLGVVQLASHLTFRSFSLALVQIKEVRKEHFSSVLFVNVIFNVIVAACIFVFAGQIEGFFSVARLSLLLRWQALYLLMLSLEPVSVTRLYRNLKFKEIGLSEVLDKLVRGCVALGFVLAGYGALSLVFGFLAGYLSKLIVSFIFLGRHAGFGIRFRLSYFRELTHVGFGAMIQDVIRSMSLQTDQMLLGKMTSPGILGFYNRAYKLIMFPVMQISRNISTVLLSGFSRMQDESHKIKAKLFKATQMTSIVAFPVFLMVSIYAEQFILFVYGEKWLPAVTPLRILVFAGAIRTIARYFGDALKAKGVVFREVLIQLLNVILVFGLGIIAIRVMGLKGMCYVVVIAALFFWLSMLVVVMKVYKVRLFEYLRVLLPSVIICSVLLAWNHAVVWLVPAKFKVFYAEVVLGGISSMALYFLMLHKLKGRCLLSTEITFIENKLRGIPAKMMSVLRRKR